MRLTMPRGGGLRHIPDAADERPRQTAAPAPTQAPSAGLRARPAERPSERPAGVPDRPAAPQRPSGVRGLDVDRVQECVRHFGELSQGARAQIAGRFAGLATSPETDRAWCDAVEAAYYRSPQVRPSGSLADDEVPAALAPEMRANLLRRRPAGTLAPYVGDLASREDCDLNGVYGFRWDAARARCVPGEPDAPSGTRDWSGEASDGSSGDIRDADDCRSRGGVVMQSGGRSACSLGGDVYPLGDGGSDTAEIVQGVVGGVLGIASTVAAIIQRGDAREFNQWMAQLQSQRQSAELQARQGDREAGLALARIQQAIAESNERAAEANRQAQEQGRQPPFQQSMGVPPWAWAVGGVAVTGLIVALIMRPAPQPIIQAR